MRRRHRDHPGRRGARRLATAARTQGGLEAFGIWPEQWDAFQIEIQRIVADPGDHVVVATRQSGRGKQSGVEVEGEFTFVFTVRDGKVTEWRIFLDEGQALAETGPRA